MTYIKEVQKELGNVRVSRSLISMVKQGNRRNTQVAKAIEKVLGRDLICPYCGSIKSNHYDTKETTKA